MDNTCNLLNIEVLLRLFVIINFGWEESDWIALFFGDFFAAVIHPERKCCYAASS